MEQSKTERFCPACAPLAQCIRKARRNPHQGYDSVIQTAAELAADGSIELLAGDCPLEEADEVLRQEKHYTVCHYLRCRSCGAVYFVGACIRGQPIFRREEPLDHEKLSRLLWGRCGSYFGEKRPFAKRQTGDRS